MSLCAFQKTLFGFLPHTLTLLILAPLLSEATKRPAAPKVPLIIHVDGKIVYNKRLNLCTAYGNVRAHKGDIHIAGDQVRIYFQKSSVITPTQENKNSKAVFPFSKGKIKKICVIGNARIQHKATLLQAPLINYDVQTEKLEALGPQIALTHPKTQISAKDSVVYDQKTNIATAYGKVWVQHQSGPEKPQGILYADQAQAQFINKNQSADAQTPALELKEIRAQGHVSFKQDKIRACADTARYAAHTQKAWFEGNVKIKENQHFAHGEKAEIDLRKKVYTLRSQTECIFYPQKKGGK